MNKIILIGNLTKKPEITETKNGQKFCNITLAVNEFGEDKAMYFKVVVWGKNAENLVKYCGKGKKLGVAGIPRIETYEDKEGNNIKDFKVVAETIEFLSPSSKEEK